MYDNKKNIHSFIINGHEILFKDVLSYELNATSSIYSRYRHDSLNLELKNGITIDVSIPENKVEVVNVVTKKEKILLKWLYWSRKGSGFKLDIKSIISTIVIALNMVCVLRGTYNGNFSKATLHLLWVKVFYDMIWLGV